MEKNSYMNIREAANICIFISVFTLKKRDWDQLSIANLSNAEYSILSESY